MNQPVLVQPNRKWVEANGVIRLSGVADETAGRLWMPRLESKGCRVSTRAMGILHSPQFTLTKAGNIEIVILKGALFADDARTTRDIRDMAYCLCLPNPNPDIACIIRSMLTDDDIEAMELWDIAVMHEPDDSCGYPRLLRVNRRDGGRWLRAFSIDSGSRWRRGRGFAFAARPTQSSS